MRAILLRSACLLAAFPLMAAAAQPAWVATCDVSAPGQAQNPSAVRTFRVGAGLFQEWQADRKAFGPNLCLSFACRGDRGKLEGRIESASVIFTLQLDPTAKTAAWRTVGASGMSRTSGACTVRPDRSVAANTAVRQ